MSFDIKQTTKDYIEHINRLNDKLISYADTIKFDVIDLKDSIKSGKLPLNIGKLENCIYFIQLNNLRNGDVEVIYDHISKLKVDDKSTKYPKVNKKNITNTNNILYVGKSKEKLQSRFNSHLKPTPKGTYGLHLENWHEQFKHIEFKLYYAPVDLIEEDKDTDILEILESGLHLYTRPLLGRSGH